MRSIVLVLAPLVLLGSAAADPLGPELLANGSFDDGARGWTFTGPWAPLDGQPGAEVTAEGLLRIDTRGRDAEVNVISDTAAVEELHRYRLSVRARPRGAAAINYKATLEWLDSSERHLAYANDWTGRAVGEEWTPHGGEFTAPAGATGVRLLLGIQAGGEIDLDEASLRLVGPRVEIARLSSDKACPAPGEPFRLHCAVRNSGGMRAEGVRLEFGLEREPATSDLGALEAGEERTVEVDLTLEAPSHAWAVARVHSTDGGDDGRRVCLVAAAPRPSGSAQVESGRARIRPRDNGVCADVLVADDGGERTVGLVRLLGAPSLECEPLPRRVSTHATWTARNALLEWESDVATGSVTIEPAGDGWFLIRSEVTATRDLAVGSFGAVEFLAGEGGAGAERGIGLLPGLEYLEPDELSSGTDSVSADLADRTIPHPNRVTVPLMAVVQGDDALGLAWDPRASWDGQRDRPCAVFSSPNRAMGQANHLMALRVPSIPEFADENRLPAARPYPLRAGETLTLECELFALPVGGDVTRLLAEWRERRTPPAAALSEEWLAGAWRRSLEAYAEGAWDEAAKGWRQEAQRQPGFAPHIARSLLRGEGLSPEARRQARAALDAALARGGPGALGFDLAMDLGHVGSALEGMLAGSELAAGQRADGTWPFVPDATTRSLGAEGDTALGTTAEPTLRLLEIAARTGDKAALAAGLRGVAAIERMPRPAGGETWEVPLHAPNLRALALALDCERLAYLLTGERGHLEHARQRARSGIAFVYAWEPADRPDMAGATISVFGATFYTTPWFGRPVQWVGLVYAQALARFAPLDPAGPWVELAEAITRSAVAQQERARSEETGNPWPGAFPDSWDLVSDTVYGSWIGPWAIADCAERLLGRHAGDVAFVDGVRVLSGAVVSEGSLAEGGLELTLTHPAASEWLLLTCAGAPSEARLDGVALARRDGPDGLEPGWWADATRGIVLVRLPAQASPEVSLTLEGLAPSEGNLRAVADELPNPSFEMGLDSWSGGTLEHGAAAEGEACLLLDARGKAAEVQSDGRPFRIEGGREYELTASVWVLSESTGYKVTVEWLDAEGKHLGYGNDWMGNDHPAAWSTHTARLRAPIEARAARLILGVRPGVAARMDSLALQAL